MKLDLQHRLLLSFLKINNPLFSKWIWLQSRVQITASVGTIARAQRSLKR